MPQPTRRRRLAGRLQRSHLLVAGIAAMLLVCALGAVLMLHYELLNHTVAPDGTLGAERPIESNLPTILTLTGIAVIAMLFAVARAVAHMDARRIAHPLSSLVAATEAIAAGKLDEQVPGSNIEELHRLSMSFRTMQSAVQRAHETLERRVRERTTDLERTTDELKKAQDDLQHKNQALERTIAEAHSATRAKSAFLANMSHEIRTPLTAILGFADLLSERVREPEHLDAVQTIAKNGQHLLSLLNDILDLSKVEAGSMEVSLERVSVFELVESVRKLMEVRAREKGLSLDVMFPGFVPETVETDPTRLRQILLNLIGNALKFTEKGGVLMVVALENMNTNKPMLVFSVMDSGIGMTDEQQTRLFQAFVQADASTTRQFGGSGLGLFISRNLARRLGGDIEVHSELEHGSIFRVAVRTGSLDGVRLLREPPDTIERRAREKRNDKGNQAWLGPIRVLLAEDTPVNQRLVGHVLERAGATVDIVNNGREAMDRFVQERVAGRSYDVVLLDMQMPVMDGYETAQAMKHYANCPPIIALTAHAMREDRERCLGAGCDGYETKPIQRAALLACIADQLALHQQRTGDAAGDSPEAPPRA